MPRITLLILIAWLIIGPILGTAVSAIAGEALGEEIVLGTVGGLAGGIMFALADGDSAVFTVLWMLAGAITLMLLYDALELVEYVRV